MMRADKRMSQRILMYLAKNDSCVRLCIVNPKESELLPVKVELQKKKKKMAAHVELMFFVDCCKLCEQICRTRKKKEKQTRIW